MNLPDFLTEHLDADIRLTGHRIGLFHVVKYYNEGYSPEMLVEQFPTLELALIHKVIAFYLENRAEVDAYVANYHTELEQQRATAPQGPGLAELRRRLESLRQVEKA
jgi:uncharacterized protein (DUF433 family)